MTEGYENTKQYAVNDKRDEVVDAKLVCKSQDNVYGEYDDGKIVKPLISFAEHNPAQEHGARVSEHEETDDQHGKAVVVLGHFQKQIDAKANPDDGVYIEKDLSRF
jgi:hypothetical protein